MPLSDGPAPGEPRYPSASFTMIIVMRFGPDLAVDDQHLVHRRCSSCTAAACALPRAACNTPAMRRNPSSRSFTIFCAPTTQITLPAPEAYGPSWLPGVGGDQHLSGLSHGLHAAGRIVRRRRPVCGSPGPASRGSCAIILGAPHRNRPDLSIVSLMPSFSSVTEAPRKISEPSGTNSKNMRSAPPRRSAAISVWMPLASSASAVRAICSSEATSANVSVPVVLASSSALSSS